MMNEPMLNDMRLLIKVKKTFINTSVWNYLMIISLYHLTRKKKKTTCKHPQGGHELAKELFSDMPEKLSQVIEMQVTLVKYKMSCMM